MAPILGQIVAAELTTFNPAPIYPFGCFNLTTPLAGESKGFVILLAADTLR